MRTCLNRLIGRCTNGCKEDYDTNHHPNNYDCVNYQEANIMEFTVKKNEHHILEEKTCHGLKNIALKVLEK